MTQTLTAGNAFANPGRVIVGDVAVMVTLVVVVAFAALWRPVRLGAVLLAGAAIPMAAQAISALIQVSEPVSPASFGVSPAQAARLGLTVSAGSPRCSGSTARSWWRCSWRAGGWPCPSVPSAVHPGASRPPGAVAGPGAVARHRRFRHGGFSH